MAVKYSDMDVERFFSKITVDDVGCWRWNAKKEWREYGLFWHNRKENKAHRVAWEMSNGDIPAGQSVCHRCDVRCCVNPDHLFLGSALDNNRDAIAKGRRAVIKLDPRFIRRGTQCGNAKLTEEKVFEIRKRKFKGDTMCALAREFGVADSVILEVCTGATWAHVGGPIYDVEDRRAGLEVSDLFLRIMVVHNGYSYKEAGKEMGVHPKVVGDIVRGRLRPNDSHPRLTEDGRASRHKRKKILWISDKDWNEMLCDAQNYASEDY